MVMGGESAYGRRDGEENDAPRGPIELEER